MFDKILNNIIPKPYEKPVTWEAFSNIKDYYLYCFEENEDKLTAYLSANQLTGRTSTSMTKGILECVITTNEDRYGNLKAALNNSAYEGLLLTTERKTDFGVFEFANKNYFKTSDLYSFYGITNNSTKDVGVRAGSVTIAHGDWPYTHLFNATEQSALSNLFINNTDASAGCFNMYGYVSTAVTSYFKGSIFLKSKYFTPDYMLSFKSYYGSGLFDSKSIIVKEDGVSKSTFTPVLGTWTQHVYRFTSIFNILEINWVVYRSNSNSTYHFYLTDLRLEKV